MQGELENALVTQEPNLSMEPGLNQSRNVGEEPNYEGLSKVSMPAAQGNENTLGSSSYHVPVMEPNSQSQLVSGIGAPSQSFPATQEANNTNLQPQKSQVSTERGKKVAKDKEKSQFQGLLNRYYPLALPLNPQNQFQITERQQGLLGTNPTRKQLRIGESSSSRNVRTRTTLLDNNQQSTPIRVGNNPSNLHGNRQQFASTQMENPPAPLLNNNQQLAPVQVDNFNNLFPENGTQMALHGANSFTNQPTLRNNNQQVTPIRMENPPTHSLNNNQQMASHHLGNFHNPSPMIDNGQHVALPSVDNSPALPNNNQQVAPIQVDNNLHNQPAQGSVNPPTPPTRYRENGLYSQVYEQMGYFADPIMRMFVASKQKRGGM
ncbi:hypothetical protein TanjilG_15490 [Lupinus angustifolius]|nr:hypothetical protein TanjilG_15490 [Lupinus angustifolius]